MGRENVYLGKRVPDVGKKGLDSLKEVEGIANAILSDYEYGRIPRRLAATRLNLLKLVVMRDEDFRGAKRRKAIKVVDEAREKFKKMNNKTGRSKSKAKPKSKRSTAGKIADFEMLWNL
ncbi:hypothetical protein [Archaeoglobus profundus]|uniref:Uncharacterized protein n=1 Tax=Archaeoglobus profundus (strain DSM 5631 / JCM 9629 / NBRC 100127 / Av18) TaxID=572546 RepID=D2RI25_ARCPA|nr:hypothetical protein [Archaeoglobus profundus]ADB57950.1 hypothetical protein Arcpr_0888 [Archaeoglobus profundus DSM 5631]